MHGLKTARGSYVWQIDSLGFKNKTTYIHRWSIWMLKNAVSSHHIGSTQGGLR